MAFSRVYRKEKKLSTLQKQGSVVFIRPATGPSPSIFSKVQRAIRPFYLWAGIGLALFILIYRSQVIGSTLHFYPTVCAGTWEAPEYAQGRPNLEFGSGADAFNPANSSLFLTGEKEITCVSFTSEEATPEMIVKNASVRFYVGLNLWKSFDTPSDPEVSPAAESSTPEFEITFDVASSTENTDGATSTAEILSADPTAPAEPASEPDPVPEAVPETSPTSDSSVPSAFWKFGITSVFAQEVVPYSEIVTPTDSDITTVAEPATSSDTVTPELISLEAVTEVATSSEAVVPETPADEIVSEPPPAGEVYGTISYSLNGQAWYVLGDITAENWNALEFTLPLAADEAAVGSGLRSFDDLGRLQFRIQSNVFSVDGQSVLYLDGMELAVGYELPARVETPEQIESIDPAVFSRLEQELKDQTGRDVILSQWPQSGPWTVFKKEENGQVDIFLKNNDTGEISAVTDSPELETEAVIGGDLIGWVTLLPFQGVVQGELFVYSITSGKTRQVTFDTFVDQLPRFLGDTLMWDKVDAEGRSHGFLYDHETGMAIQAPGEPFIYVHIPTPEELTSPASDATEPTEEVPLPGVETILQFIPKIMEEESSTP